jgi:hypothetical protein
LLTFHEEHPTVRAILTGDQTDEQRTPLDDLKRFLAHLGDPSEGADASTRTHGTEISLRFFNARSHFCAVATRPIAPFSESGRKLVAYPDHCRLYLSRFQKIIGGSRCVCLRVETHVQSVLEAKNNIIGSDVPLAEPVTRLNIGHSLHA